MSKFQKFIEFLVEFDYTKEQDKMKFVFKKNSPEYFLLDDNVNPNENE